MKIYLQRREDGTFLLPEGSWGKAREEALAFPRTADAVLHANKHKLSGVQIILFFDEGERYTTVIPLEAKVYSPRG